MSQGSWGDIQVVYKGNIQQCVINIQQCTDDVLIVLRHSPSSSGSAPSLITVSMARHAAESAATMCGFAVAVVNYSHSFKPYKLAVEKLLR